MKETMVIAGLLLLLAAIVFARPQWVSTVRHYTDEQLRNVDLKRIRREAGRGLVLLAILIGGGELLLAAAQVPESTRTVLQIIAVAVGILAIAARAETHNHNR